VKIVDVKAYPLTAPIDPDIQKTSAGNFAAVSIVLVEVTTDDGLTGWGEALARWSPGSYATLIETLLKPILIGQSPFDAGRLWQRMSRVLTGRAGGILIEAVAACDIALWDLMGKATGQPICRLLGGFGRSHVDAYASSISWGPDAVALEQTRVSIAQGFKTLKIKIGQPLDQAIARAKLIREAAGPRIKLTADANWVFDYDDSVKLARALLDLDYYWLEEPIVPEDLEGYRRLRAAVPIRFAAGESEFTAQGARDLIASRAVGVIQPDCARSGGISETRNIAMLAHAHHVPYAPHVGFSGAVCVAASLHLAAAMPNFLTVECMIFPNRLRDGLTLAPVGDPGTLVDGALPVPQGPGLGIEIDRAALAELRAS